VDVSVSGVQAVDIYSDAGSGMVTQQTMNYNHEGSEQSNSHAHSMYNKTYQVNISSPLAN